MRILTVLVLLGSLTTSLLAGPAEAEEAALARRVTALLAADTAKDRAWGAYFAGKHGLSASVPRLIELVKDHAKDDGFAGQALRRALLDAILRLGGRPDQETCKLLLLGNRTSMVVLLSTWGPEAEPLLLPLLSEKEGTGPFVGMAVRMLLAEGKSPHLAADLLEDLELYATVSVMSKNSAIGVGGRGFNQGNPKRRELIPILPGWPPAVRYQLTDRATPGVVLLVNGTHPIYYRRMEVARGEENALSGETPDFPRQAFNLRCLAHIMRWDMRFLGLKHYADNMIWYENDEQYIEEAQPWLDRIREKYANLVKQLVSRKLLTEEEAGGMRLKLDITVHDMRPPEERTNLPAVK